MELFKEITQYHTSSISLTEKYKRLYALLDRTCKQLSASYKIDSSNLFSRLYIICKHTNYRRSSIEQFRINARHILQGDIEPDDTDYLYDLKALCAAISHFYNTPIPKELVSFLPKEWRNLSDFYQRGAITKRIRIVVEYWDNEYLYGYSDEYPTDTPLQINYRASDIFYDITDLIYTGAQLNLLSVTSDEAGILTPELFILEPDFLIDVSTLAECFQNYGCSALNYLVNKFRPRETSHYILLGNAANQFLDDCVNEQPDQPATFDNSMQKIFRTDVLGYSVCEKVDREFFEKAHMQFRHIHTIMTDFFASPTCQIDKHGALLEPSFLCECMGLQGRMDFLQCDFRNLIELKSGKADGIGNNIRSKENHALQMALYKEILYYNLDVPRDAVTTYLFYSQYPKMFAERSSKTQIQRAIQLRNRIIANEHALREDGGRTLIPSITSDALNTYHVKGRLWEEFQRPQLEQFLAPFHRSDSLATEYFYTFTAFIEREQFLSKIGNSQNDSSNGFAATWNTDTLTKQAVGNILTDLRITGFEENEGIEKIELEVPVYEDNFLPNFRVGDIILLYERNNEQNNATNRQVTRGCIEKINNTEIIIYLRNKQRNPIVFRQESKYAIEHDFMDSSYSNLYRGLYSLLIAPQERRDLLLSQRAPRTDTTVKLNNYLPNKQINDIVLAAKQAQDYFLLVGPPGTGKTSVTLKAMVEEFYSEPEYNLLLLSYTNRAVDEICEMLESISYQPDYLRIGSELSCEERFRPRLLKNLTQTCKKRSDIRSTIDNIRIVTGTVSSIAGRSELFHLKHFNVAIIDEASQILEPHIIGILSTHINQVCAIDKFILIGDHKQLPAVVQQRPEESLVTSALLQAIGLTNCRNSLFERLYAWHSLNSAPDSNIVSTLDKQGRMHPEISAFANKLFYNGLLKEVPVPHQTEPLKWQQYNPDDLIQNFIANTRVGFIDTPYPPAEEPDKINRYEALLVARMVKGIYDLCKLNSVSFKAAKRIGIIVPFRSQIAMITQELCKLTIPETESITIDTVERYQGSQRDIIIYSTTISQNYQLDILSAPIEINEQLIDRKLNVAITRARKQLFTIGNAHLLEKQHVYREFIKDSVNKGTVEDMQWTAQLKSLVLQ